MLNHALDYLSKGLSIIPGNPATKRPYVEWAEFQTRLPTVSQLERWWRKWPNACILMITGEISGMVVIDVDNPKGGDHTKFTSDVMVKTPNGYHFYYKHPGYHVPNSAGTIALGVDFRGDGGYVVIPPMKYGEKEYKWIKNFGLGALPDIVSKHKEHVSRNEPGWVEDLLNLGCKEGTRDNSVTKLAGHFLNKKIPIDQVIIILTQWMEKQEDPLPVADIEKCVHSVAKTAMRQEAQVEPESKVEEEQKKPKFTYRTHTSYMDEYCMLRQSWLIDGWLMQDTIGFLVAPPGSYKTWIEFDMAISVAGGYPFLGNVRNSVQGPVLVIQQEDYPGQIVERFATIQGERENVILPYIDQDKNLIAKCHKELPIYFHDQAAFSLDDDEMWESFEQAIKDLEPKLVIIDPLYSALKADDYMAAGARGLLRLKQLRTKYGTTFLISHHTGKAATTLERQRMWGSQFLNAALESGYQIIKLDEQSIIVARHMKGAPAFPYTHITFNIDTGHDLKYKVSARNISKEEADNLMAGRETVLSEHAAEIMALLSDGLGHALSAISLHIKASATDTKKALRELDLRAKSGEYKLSKERLVTI